MPPLGIDASKLPPSLILRLFLVNGYSRTKLIDEIDAAWAVFMGALPEERRAWFDYPDEDPDDDPKPDQPGSA
jgi:hypothetical protein